MKLVIKEILSLFVLTIALAVSLFLFWAYSLLLDFFPWGNDKAYVIWEPLVRYFIVPGYLTIGCLVILLSKQRNYAILGFHLLFIGLSFTLPSVFGFDSDTDLKGRWCGVVVSVIAAVLTINDILNLIRRLGKMQSTV